MTALRGQCRQKIYHKSRSAGQSRDQSIGANLLLANTVLLLYNSSSQLHLVFLWWPPLGSTRVHITSFSSSFYIYSRINLQHSMFMFSVLSAKTRTMFTQNYLVVENKRHDHSRLSFQDLFMMKPCLCLFPGLTGIPRSALKLGKSQHQCWW